MAQELIKWFVKYGKSYDDSRAIFKQVRKDLDLKPKKSKPRTDYLTESEMITFINAAYSMEGKKGLMMQTLIWTGLRVAEFVDLNIEHIDLQERTIRVLKGKGEKYREIPMTQELSHSLCLHIGERKTGPVFLKERHHPKNGFRYSRRRVQQIVKEIAANAGIEKPVYPHALRTTFGTWLLNKGMSMEMVSQLMGHDNIETTKRHYAFMNLQTKRDALDRVVAKDGNSVNL